MGATIPVETEAEQMASLGKRSMPGERPSMGFIDQFCTA
jgi:hypothetical protein